MVPGLLGLGIVILALRVAHADEENPFLWGLLAALLWFVPMFLLSTGWSILGVVLLFGVYFAWRLRRKDPRGRGLVR